ncbi:sigma-54-dependent transcriptional regulator [Aromatoleum aromaticum]|uniref:Sigma-54 interacting response regulator n=1 Tax=Aromatoleum aromaticum (strain DSM 19018 / LMG 30748 / EbN1) TaxID=76114 RepID=Q5NY04_AROAE|nr:sigma-54 dependent transcriptional regulator [Aromatoleum aromaticum]NMG55159.1 response regulator [Aromatoleum aromaticum]CAI10060.1 putative sigma-54 interacting response regulator [Aromatoleum aromaticum EbN1]
MSNVLLVDDDPESLGWLTEFIKGEGYSVATADSLRAARIHLTRSTPDVVLTDLMLPDGLGIELVGELESRDTTEVVLITGHASVETAIDALRSGATDYLVKPVDIERLRGILQRIPKAEHFRQEIGELRNELRKLGRVGHILGSSPPMHRLYDQLSRVAPTSASVLLIGESGTGKEVVAQSIHDLSRRKRHPFLPLNCGAVSPQLVESELFGHEKGSFTGADRQHHGFFERANRGTLFLDEVTEMRPELQVKLLRVLETGTFMRVGTNEHISTDVRLIAATNRSPEKAVAEGRMREDLYHRLNVFPIYLPPLRERGTDIELLAEHFLAELNEQEQTNKRFSPAAIAALYAHSWPGNVRELKNYVHRAFILADDVIEPDHAPENSLQKSNSSVITIRVGTPLDEVNRRVMEATLMECGNVKRKAAEMLGISLKTLYNRLAVYNAGKEDLYDEEDAEEFAGGASEDEGRSSSTNGLR